MITYSENQFPVSTPIKIGAAPAGANVAVYSQLYDTDYGYACQTVTQSTLFSIVPCRSSYGLRKGCFDSKTKPLYPLFQISFEIWFGAL